MSVFIEWCNVNEGFISGVLAFFTFLTSLIAIVISLHSAHLPYYKKINIYPVFEIDEQKNYYTEVFITNVGNKIIGISDITVEDEKMNVGFISYFPKSIVFIKPAETYNVKIGLSIKEETDFIRKVKVIILDTEGKKHTVNMPFVMG